MTGIERLFTGMRASSSALTAGRTRIDLIAENLANAEVTRTPNGGPYKRKLAVFEPLLRQTPDGRGYETFGVRVAGVMEDQTEGRNVLDPAHPDADPETGMVAYPNVNAVVEMADLVSAMRAYEANVTAQQSFVEMAEAALRLAE